MAAAPNKGSCTLFLSTSELCLTSNWKQCLSACRRVLHIGMHVPAGEGGADDLSAAEAAAEAVQGQEGGARGADS